MRIKPINGSRASVWASTEMIPRHILRTSFTFLSKVRLNVASAGTSLTGMTGGLTNRYGVAHEQWMWDLKSEPAIVDVFAQIWGTNELLASFGKDISIIHYEANPQMAATSAYHSKTDHRTTKCSSHGHTLTSLLCRMSCIVSKAS